MPDKVVSFAIVGGDGSLDAATATTNANGTAIVPPRTLGRKDEPQIVRATLEALFNTELMTGFLDSGFNPLSAITIGGSRTWASR